MKKKYLKKKKKDQIRLEIQKIQIQRLKKKFPTQRISAFIFDPSSDKALEILRYNSFSQTTIRKIKNFPFKVIKLIQNKKRLLQIYGIRTWFSSRRQIFNCKLYWLKKNRKILKQTSKLKKKLLEKLFIKVYEKIKNEKKEFHKKSNFFANEIMEAEADYLRLINLQKYYENKIK